MKIADIRACAASVADVQDMQLRGTHQYFCKSYQMFFDACLPQLRERADVIGGGYQAK